MELGPDEHSQLLAALGCSSGAVNEQEAVIEKFAAAAKEEYVRMALGQKVHTRGSDIREYRLFLLIKNVFNGRLPSEQQICDIFQSTVTQSRSLLRAVMSKYQYELQVITRDSLMDLLMAAKRPGTQTSGPYRVVVDSECMVETLNRRAATIDGTLPQVAKVPRTVGTYEIAESTYARLMNDLRDA